METRKLVVSGLLIFLTASVNGQRQQRFVLLPESEASRLEQYYPKDGPERIDSGWRPSELQIKTLEANLVHVSDLRSGGALIGEKIAHPEQYFRQYLGVIRAGKKLIYLDALCREQYVSNWREHITIVMDGGNCFWQAWYDPATEKFSSLYINGRA